MREGFSLSSGRLITAYPPTDKQPQNKTTNKPPQFPLFLEKRPFKGLFKYRPIRSYVSALRRLKYNIAAKSGVKRGFS